MMLQIRIQSYTMIVAALVAIGTSTHICEAFVHQLQPTSFVRKTSTLWSNKKEINEDPAEEILISRDAASRDDNQSSSSLGVMSAFFELAHEIADNLHQQKEEYNQANKKKLWNDQHLAHAASELHEETPLELKESEEAAAWDAHDCSDPGMEAAAEERAVMLANELMHKKKEQALSKKSPESAFFELAHEIADDLHRMKEEHKHDKAQQKKSSWNSKHVAHGASELHEETSLELKESEEAAAWDAHDCSDPGMEAAAEERAVMLANELMHKAKEKVTKGKKQGTS